jgi:hypothetical protein
MTTFETWTVPAKRIDYQAAAQERNRRRRKLRDAAPDLLAALIELDALGNIWQRHRISTGDI